MPSPFCGHRAFEVIVEANFEPGLLIPKLENSNSLRPICRVIPSLLGLKYKPSQYWTTLRNAIEYVWKISFAIMCTKHQYCSNCPSLNAPLLLTVQTRFHNAHKCWKFDYLKNSADHICMPSFVIAAHYSEYLYFLQQMIYAKLVF